MLREEVLREWKSCKEKIFQAQNTWNNDKVAVYRNFCQPRPERQITDTYQIRLQRIYETFIEKRNPHTHIIFDRAITEEDIIEEIKKLKGKIRR